MGKRKGFNIDLNLNQAFKVFDQFFGCDDPFGAMDGEFAAMEGDKFFRVGTASIGEGKRRASSPCFAASGVNVKCARLDMSTKGGTRPVRTSAPRATVVRIKK